MTHHGSYRLTPVGGLLPLEGLFLNTRKTGYRCKPLRRRVVRGCNRPNGSPFHVGEQQTSSRRLQQLQITTDRRITSSIGTSPCRLNGNVTGVRGVTRGRTDIDGSVKPPAQNRRSHVQIRSAVSRSWGLHWTIRTRSLCAPPRNTLRWAGSLTEPGAALRRLSPFRGSSVVRLTCNLT
jgi:hypothetical protein